MTSKLSSGYGMFVKVPCRFSTSRLPGYSIAETARQRGMTPKRVRRLLKELYRVYFQLYLQS